MQTIKDRVKRLLNGVPEELHGIFGVCSLYEIGQLESAYRRLASRGIIRKNVMDMQKKYGLSFAPNMSIEKVSVLIKLKAKLQKKKNLFPNYDDDNLSDV